LALGELQGSSSPPPPLSPLFFLSLSPFSKKEHEGSCRNQKKTMPCYFFLAHWGKSLIKKPRSGRITSDTSSPPPFLPPPFLLPPKFSFSPPIEGKVHKRIDGSPPPFFFFPPSVFPPPSPPFSWAFKRFDRKRKRLAWRQGGGGPCFFSPFFFSLSSFWL